MTDESRTANPAASIHVNHYCCIEGCGKWGGFGFARSRGETPTWWCWEHYPHKPNRPSAEVIAVADSFIVKP
jgi:hypothetical protein